MADEKDLAQADLRKLPIRPGQIYRHYKGGLYVITAVSLKEDTLEPMVTYRSNLKDSDWTRTPENFTSAVDTETEYTLPDGSKRMGRPRFTRAKE